MSSRTTFIGAVEIGTSKITVLVGEYTGRELATRLATASEGNFQYIEYVLAELGEHRHEESDPFDLDSLESGSNGSLGSRLRGYYEVRFWGPMTTVRDTRPESWERLFRPVLEQICIAAEARSSIRRMFSMRSSVMVSALRVRD